MDLKYLGPKQNGPDCTENISSAFSWIKNHCSLLHIFKIIFISVRLTISQHWCKSWLGADQATSHFKITQFTDVGLCNIWTYCHTSNIRLTLVGDKIIDHSDVVGASPFGAAPTTSSFSNYHWHCSNYIFILDLTSGFNGLDKDNCKTKWETFQFWDLVSYIRGFMIVIMVQI